LTEVEAIQLDATDAESVKAARAEIGQKTDVLDVLINNAGILGGMDQVAELLTLSPEERYLKFAVNAGFCS
jgi:NAD(P)-dependent dehydrogenase (short-subunit alcohol dehydrogenase family)